MIAGQCGGLKVKSVIRQKIDAIKKPRLTIVIGLYVPSRRELKVGIHEIIAKLSHH